MYRTEEVSFYSCVVVLSQVCILMENKQTNIRRQTVNKAKPKCNEYLKSFLASKKFLCSQTRRAVWVFPLAAPPPFLLSCFVLIFF